jgi:uncharacterized membrane protein YeaQ/YmgE (transglycosylase-associated protein family)
MSELLAFAAPMLVLAAMACGWTADAFSPAHGYGLLIDMGLGLAGAVVLATVLHGANVFGPVGLVVTLLIGAIGGTSAIVAQRRFWQSAAL